MKVLNPNDTTHEIELIPRYYPLGALKLEFYNETTQEATNLTNIYVINDGIMTISFDLTVSEGEKHQFRLIDGYNIVYRGKIRVTSQETEDFKDTNNAYYY